MPLFKIKSAPEVVVREKEMCKIRQRRLQILVHSYIYYDLGEELVSDAKWQQWANELVILQKDFPEESKKVIYSKEFEGFDGTTGYHLPYRMGKIPAKAHQLLDYAKNMIKGVK